MNKLLNWISMDNESYVKERFRRHLWGYPDLFKLFEGVGLALAEEREKRRREKEDTEQQRMTTENVINIPEVLAEDNGKTAPDPSQSSKPTYIDGGSRLSDVRKIDSQLDGRGQPDDHLPTSTTCDERPLRAATSATIEVLESMSVIPIPQPNLDEVAGTPNELEEVPSTLENKYGGSRNAHRKEESGM